MKLPFHFPLRGKISLAGVITPWAFLPRFTLHFFLIEGHSYNFNQNFQLPELGTCRQRLNVVK